MKEKTLEQIAIKCARDAVASWSGNYSFQASDMVKLSKALDALAEPEDEECEHEAYEHGHCLDCNHLHPSNGDLS